MSIFETPTNLMDLTGQESGIAVYSSGSVIVANWGSYPDFALPVAAPVFGSIGFPGTEWTLVEKHETNDIRKELPGHVSATEEGGETVVSCEGMEVVWDEYGDIPALYGIDAGRGACLKTGDDGNLVPTSGTVYILDTGSDTVKIIAPRSWN